MRIGSTALVGLACASQLVWEAAEAWTPTSASDLSAIDAMAKSGKPVGTCSIEGMDWAELDTLEDWEIYLARAKRFFKMRFFCK